MCGVEWEILSQTKLKHHGISIKHRDNMEEFIDEENEKKKEAEEQLLADPCVMSGGMSGFSFHDLCFFIDFVALSFKVLLGFCLFEIHD